MKFSVSFGKHAVNILAALLFFSIVSNGVDIETVKAVSGLINAIK